MQLENIQYLLNRLYTEEPFRNSFFADREAFFAGQNISCPQTMQFLKELKQEQVDFFAHSLYHKRAQVVSQLLPGTAFLLGKQFFVLFKKFSQGFNPGGMHQHHEDAFAFCDVLEDPQQGDAFFKTLLKFEKTQVGNFLKLKKWSLAFYSYQPILLKQLLMNGQKELVKKTPTLVAWKKGMIYKVWTF